MSFIANLGDWLRKISRSFSDVSVNGQNIVLTRHNGDTTTITTQDTNTTYNPATQSADGLMSATDKVTFDAIPDTYAVKTGTLVNNPISRTSPSGRIARIQQGTTNAEIIDFGWDWDNADGATLGLRSSSHLTQAGNFELTARDETNFVTLLGTPSGILQWNNHKVITIVDEATTAAAGVMSATDKVKLDGITAGAEPNQNTFSNVKVGSITVAADGKTDTLELVAGNNVTLTPDATNDKITIAATDTVTTVTSSGSGNAVTSITASNGALTVQKDSTFLPLSGGTLSGALTVNDHIYAPFHIWNTFDSGELQVHGGTGWHGGILTLHGKDQTNLKGYARLIAHDGTNYRTLEIRPDGTFNFGGNPVAVITNHSIGGSGYIKFSDGLQLVWGITNTVATGTVVTFARAFASGTTPTVMLSMAAGSAYTTVIIPIAYPRSATSMTVYTNISSGHHNANVVYLAIGKGA